MTDLRLLVHFLPFLRWVFFVSIELKSFHRYVPVVTDEVLSTERNTFLTMATSDIMAVSYTHLTLPTKLSV